MDKETTKWYEVSPRNTSALRIGFMISIICGAIGLLFCIVFSLLLYHTERWEGIPIVTTIATASISIMAVGDIVKSIQKKSETKEKY